MAGCGIDVFGWAPLKVWISESKNWQVAPEKWHKNVERLVKVRLVKNGQSWNSYCGLNFWELRSWMKNEARLAIKKLGGKREEQGRQARKISWEVPCTIYKMAPSCRTWGKGKRQPKKRRHAAWKWKVVVRDTWRKERRNKKKRSERWIE